MSTEDPDILGGEPKGDLDDILVPLDIENDANELSVSTAAHDKDLDFEEDDDDVLPSYKETDEESEILDDLPYDETLGDGELFGEGTGFEDDRLSNKNIPQGGAAVNKLFQKAIEMEDDLEQLRLRYEEVKNEKQVLEDQISEKDKRIFDTSSRLEDSMNRMHSLRTDIDTREKELRNLQKENQMLQDIRHISVLAKERMRRLGGKGRRGGRRGLSTDRMAKIVALEDSLKHKRDVVKNLEKEISTLQGQLKQKDSTIDKLSHDLKGQQMEQEKAYQVECRNTELQYQVDTLKKEIRTLKQITRMKSQTIQQLNVQIESWKHLEESHNDMQKQMKTKQMEVRKLLGQLNGLRKENRKKEREIKNIIEERDDLPIKCLEQDKKYLKEQIAQSLDKRTKLEQTVKNQEKEIRLLKKRMEHLNIALKETEVGKMIMRKRKARRVKKKGAKKEEDEIQVNFDTQHFIQKNLYLLMKKDAQILRKKKDNLALLLQEKDVAVDSLSQKIETLKKARDAEEKLQKAKLREVKGKIKALSNQLKSAEDVFKKKEFELKSEVATLRRKMTVGKRGKGRRKKNFK